MAVAIVNGLLSAGRFSYHYSKLFPVAHASSGDGKSS